MRIWVAWVATGKFVHDAARAGLSGEVEVEPNMGSILEIRT